MYLQFVLYNLLLPSWCFKLILDTSRMFFILNASFSSNFIATKMTNKNISPFIVLIRSSCWCYPIVQNVECCFIVQNSISVITVRVRTNFYSENFSILKRIYNIYLFINLILRKLKDLRTFLRTLLLCVVTSLDVVQLWEKFSFLKKVLLPNILLQLPTVHYGCNSQDSLRCELYTVSTTWLFFAISHLAIIMKSDHHQKQPSSTATPHISTVR